MSFDFYVIDGRKMIDYKPTEEHYKRAFERYLDKSTCVDDILNDESGKLLFLLIKLIGKNRKNIRDESKEKVEALFALMELVKNIVSRKTPRQLMQLFPLDKEYDGGEDWKDYYWCMEYINEIGIDKPIEDNAVEFLMNYQNQDITIYALTMMATITAISIIKTGVDPLDEFLDETGVSPRTMYQDGDYMIDSETGERFAIRKPQNPLKKLFSVVS